MILRRRTPSSSLTPENQVAEETRRPAPDRAARIAMKEERARDAALAMEEYEAEKRAVLANTERLRALRLAQEAGNGLQKKSKKQVKKDR
jgi:hypothetical protein